MKEGKKKHVLHEGTKMKDIVKRRTATALKRKADLTGVKENWGKRQKRKKDGRKVKASKVQGGKNTAFR